MLAIPGSIHSPQSRGCHALIKQGAKLVESVGDILDELRPASGAAVRAGTAPNDGPDSSAAALPEPDAGDRGAILAALGYDPVTLDTLAARTGWPPAELNIRLLDLELAGSVARLPGQRFQRIARG